MPRSVAKNRGCGWNQPDCSALFGTRHYVDYAELGIIHIMPSSNLCREHGSHPRVAPSGLVWSAAGLGINLQVPEERQQLVIRVE